MALSGGTLIALGAREIAIGRNAALSAVDPVLFGRRAKHIEARSGCTTRGFRWSPGCPICSSTSSTAGSIDGGLRRGEILGLQWSDLDLKRGIIAVRHNIVRGKVDVPKGRTEEDVGLTSRLSEALQAFPRTGVFVLDNEGSHDKEHNMKSWMTTLVKRAGLPRRGTHIPPQDLRDPDRQRCRRRGGRGRPSPPQGPRYRESVCRPARGFLPRDQGAGELMEARCRHRVIP